MSFVATAIAGGTALYGAVNANQKKQRNKGYIDASYRRATDDLNTNQAAIGQQTAESLNQRGLLNGGPSSSPVHAAMAGTTANPAAQLATSYYDRYGKHTLPSATQAPQPNDVTQAERKQAPSTLGDQARTDLSVQFARERTDLDQQRGQAQTENKADYANALLSAGVNGVAGAFGLHNTLQDINTLRGGSAPAPAAGKGIDDIRSALGGKSLASQSRFGVDPVSPLSAPDSAWNTKNTIVGSGEKMSEFNSGV